jgi:hypothetical protein
MQPIRIGYFARRPWNRAEDQRLLPPQVMDMCNVGQLSNGPPDWINQWRHNDLWVYSTEARAWAAAVNNANLHRFRAELSRHWDGKPGSVEIAIDDYIARHVPPPGASLLPAESRINWRLYAYRMFPMRVANGIEVPYEIRGDGVQPLPADYTWLGLDIVSRERDLEFCYSPLDCNGWCNQVAVNRYCLVDQPEIAFQLP